jgi:hypothetical protein
MGAQSPASSSSVGRSEPLTYRLLELPGVSRRSMALLGPLHGLFVDG